ncbi:MAG: hypothetical protein LUG60_04395 [Erysipelotrichaceae bacterium]|nr:hypothetical protein [Erysipelotrichaceae bacterium]
MNWEDLFDEDVVNRGYGYYMEKRVRNFQINGEVVNAQVLGAHKYDVEIHISNNHIVDMECNCYYGEKCKHIAAVMHYLDEHYGGIPTNISKLSTYKRKVDQCCCNKTKNFIEKIQNIIYEDVNDLMNHDNYLDAFELTAYILDKVDNEEIVNECIQIFEEIIIYADDPLMNEMNLWMEECAERSYTYLSEEIQRLLNEYFY